MTSTPRKHALVLLLLVVLAITSALVNARSVPALHHVEPSSVDAVTERTHGRSTEEAATISITVKAHREHKYKSNTCAPQECKVHPDDANVCGSDGKVYYNACLFQNAQCRNAALTQVTSWNGHHCPSTCTKPIVCKEIGKFLCGSDGNVYFGYCRLYSAQCVDAALEEIACPPGLIQIPPRQRRE